jgi:hypothetical protein
LAISFAWLTIVSENDEKYRYSRNICSGGTVSVICTREHDGQNARFSG